MNLKIQQRMSSQSIYLLENEKSENSKSISFRPNKQSNKSSRIVDKILQHFNSYLSYIKTSTCSNISSITKDKQFRKNHKRFRNYRIIEKIAKKNDKCVIQQVIQLNKRTMITKQISINIPPTLSQHHHAPLNQ